jgi:hypothetical protein
MFHLASTRFNNATLAENMAYRAKMATTVELEKEKEEAVVYYGSLIKVHKKVSVGAFMFVFEMNNDINQIEGISLVRNTLVLDKKHRIYSNDDYNRYTYKGIHWLSRKQIMELDSGLVETFDRILFKGKTHMKRACGITVLNEKLMTTWSMDLNVEKERVRRIFLQKDLLETEVKETEVISEIKETEVISEVISEVSNKKK